jgi:hypothetical protein
MDDPPLRSTDPSTLREAMARRLYRRALVTGQITLPAVPEMLDEYVNMCDTVFAGGGVEFTEEELAHLETALEASVFVTALTAGAASIDTARHAVIG